MRRDPGRAMPPGRGGSCWWAMGFDRAALMAVAGDLIAAGAVAFYICWFLEAIEAIQVGGCLGYS